MSKDLIDEIKNDELSAEMIFQKHFIDKPSFFFCEFLKNPNDEYLFKSNLASRLKTSINAINIVGSGQVGISFRPDKNFKKFDGSNSVFKMRSDLDVAIIDANIFNQINIDLQKFTNLYKDKTNWKVNKYYSDPSSQYFICNNFFEYFARGWLRVDFLPQSFNDEVITHMDTIQDQYWKSSKIRLKFAIYRNWNDFITYHVNTINELRNIQRNLSK